MSRRVRVDPEAAGLVRVGRCRGQEGSGAQGYGLVASGDEVIHGQVDVQVGIKVALTDDDEVELGADTAVGLIAAAAAKVAIEKRLDRVKICPADNCRWAFYDSSRNHSRQWCSMKVCGNRAKARAHRQRSSPS